MLRQSYVFRLIKQGLGMLCKWNIGGDYILLSEVNLTSLHRIAGPSYVSENNNFNDPIVLQENPHRFYPVNAIKKIH